MTTEKLRIGSLFSGYGGLDLAVEHIFNATPAWFVEFEEAPSKILAHHWPGVPNLGDVTKVDWSEVEPVDIITGGYPCQPFSTAGKRRGTNDARHLWPYVREAIRHLRPRLTILENVAGHLTLGFDRVLGDMAEDGLHVRWTCLRASEIGAPHHRQRLFIAVSPDPNSFGLQTRRLQRRQSTQIAGDHLVPNALPRPSRRQQLHPNDPITTWEMLTRPMPCPVEVREEASLPNTDWEALGYEHMNSSEAPDLRHERISTSPAFSEWMMGLPDGWVTSPDIGLTRAQQLKAIGNGVCPQQAATALTHLLQSHTGKSTNALQRKDPP